LAPVVSYHPMAHLTDATYAIILRSLLVLALLLGYPALITALAVPRAAVWMSLGDGTPFRSVRRLLAILVKLRSRAALRAPSYAVLCRDWTNMQGFWLVMLTTFLSAAAGAADVVYDTQILESAIGSEHRSAQSKARDMYRHPSQTLLFFGLRPGMHVLEVWPGAGWYTEILAPVLREHGKYYAAHYYVDEKSSSYTREARDAYLRKLASRPDIYGRVVVAAVDPPSHMLMAPLASVDLVLTFRNVHSWLGGGRDQLMFKGFFAALKPGGVLGVVEHRAQRGLPIADMRRTGYVTEDYVVELAQRAGFRLEARAEINANPRDSRRHPAGVWTLPPTLRLADQNRPQYLAIGESDRMTLKFVKPLHAR
jgi:predicted methyltransferase